MSVPPPAPATLLRQVSDGYRRGLLDARERASLKDRIVAGASDEVAAVARRLATALGEELPGADGRCGTAPPLPTMLMRQASALAASGVISTDAKEGIKDQLRADTGRHGAGLPGLCGGPYQPLARFV